MVLTHLKFLILRRIQTKGAILQPLLLSGVVSVSTGIHTCKDCNAIKSLYALHRLCVAYTAHKALVAKYHSWGSQHILSHQGVLNDSHMELLNAEGHCHYSYVVLYIRPWWSSTLRC